MNATLLCLLLVVAYFPVVIASTYRFKNGSFTKGNGESVVTSGFLAITKIEEELWFHYYGTNHASMDCFHIHAEYNSKQYDYKYYSCKEFTWNNGTRVKSTGSIRLDARGNTRKIKGECKTEQGEKITFDSTNEAASRYYSPEEAGLRAKYLIGRSAEKFKARHVINFAVMDYLYGHMNCPDIATDHYPLLPGPKPGALIVGKDGTHCGILDNEGTKFIHSNPVTKKVTYESLVVANKYFPSGILYKRYPSY